MELAIGLLFTSVTLQLDSLGLLSALPAYLYLAAIGVALAVTDLEERRLPNAIVLPSYPVLALLLLVSAASQGDWLALIRAGIGGTALFAFYLVLALFSPSGMGMGDVKLAGCFAVAQRGVEADLLGPLVQPHVRDLAVVARAGR